MTFKIDDTEEEFWRRHIKSRRIIDVDMAALSSKKKRKIERKIKGKRYDFKTYDELAEARKVFEDAGDITYSNANPITGEYWFQVILIGGKVKKELPG